MADLKHFAELLWNIGISNLYVSSNKIDEVNYIESNILKAPSLFGTSNIVSVNDDIDWDKYSSFGVFLGFDSIMAIDLDGVISERLLNDIIEVLGLPKKYPWIIKSGSQCGYHILLRCANSNITKEPDEIRRKWKNINIENVDKFGCLDTNAFYPDQHRFPRFHKIEFKWTGNITLPPSLHASGNKYNFLHDFPNVMPYVVDFELLEKVKNKFTSFQALSSTSHDFDYVEGDSGGFYLDIVKSHTYTGYRFADSDLILYNYEHRPMELATAFYISQYSVYGVQQKLLFMNQISWFVVDSRHNIVKRRIFNYYSGTLLGDEFCGSLHIDESNTIVDNCRYVFHELLFDINHSKKIYCWNEANIDRVKSEIWNAGLYPDAFKNIEISVNGDIIDMSESSSGQTMKSVEYIEDLIVKDEYRFKDHRYLLKDMNANKQINTMAFLYSIYTNFLLVKGLRYWIM